MMRRQGRGRGGDVAGVGERGGGGESVEGGVEDDNKVDPHGQG